MADRLGAYALRGGLAALGVLTAPAAGWAADTGEKVVSELTVTAQRAREASGLKTSAPLAEIPQSVSVITAEQINLRGALTIQDVLLYTGGVRSDPYGNDGRVDGANIRSASPAQYLDGMRQPYGVYNQGRVDPYALERVEVLRGPASVLYGQGSIGGVINMVTKRPGFEKAGEAILSYGSHNRKQAQLDVTGPIDEAGRFAFRLTSLLRKSGTQVDHIDDDRWFIAPSLTWRPSERADVTVMLHHQRDRTGSTTQFLPWEGRLFDNPNGHLPSNLFVGEPDWEKYDTNQTNLTIVSQIDLTETWRFRQNARAAWSEVVYQTAYARVHSTPLSPWVLPGQPGYVAPKRSMARTLSGSYPRVVHYTVDNQLEGRFATGPLEHTLLVGADFQDYKQKLRSIVGSANTVLDFYNPVYGNYFIPASTPGNTSKQDQLGVYLQDQIKAGPLTIVAGVRRDRATTTTITPLNVRTRAKDKATTYRLGALYTFANGLAPYVSYSESFTPVAGGNLAGEPFKPQVGRQYEAGLKYQPVPSLLFTAAVYDLKETNRVTNHPTNPLDRVQTGEASAKGFEFEAQGAIGEAWIFTSAFSYTDAEVSKSNVAGEVGKPFASVPKYVASAWAVRRFQVGDDSSIRLGGGVRYIGKSVDRNAASTVIIRTPAYTLADLIVSYEHADWRLALNVNNLFDKDYDSTCLARGDCFIGARRSVVASLAYRF